MPKIKKLLLAAAGAGVALVTLGSASIGQSQTAAYPASTQKFSVTAPGIWNQLYFYDYYSGTGTMGNLNVGSTTAEYSLRSSFSVTTAYSNYKGIFIYDYDAGRWLEVFFAADATDFIW